MRTVTFRRLAAAACALIATGALAGCGSTRTAGAPRPAATRSATSVPTSTQPSAQDGTNYRACVGGDCEIAVSTPVTITLSDLPTDAGPLTVQQVSTDSVAMSMGLPAGASLSATVKIGCIVAFYGNNASGLADTSCSGEPGDITGMYVKQTVNVEAITDGTAILKLKSE